METPSDPKPEAVIDRPTRLWTAVERTAARQHGVLALWQALRLGLIPSTVVRHVQRHGWMQVDRGIWTAPWSNESFARRCAIERVRGSRARLITGGAALTLLGARKGRSSMVDLWVGPALSPTVRLGVRIHRGAWVTGDRVIRVERLPCVPALRMLRDAARSSSVDRLAKDIAALDRLRYATPAQILANLDQTVRFPGRPKLLTAAHAAMKGLTHSGDETLARQLLAGLPYVLHHRPLLIEHHRRRLGEIDIAVCAIRYGTEIDGVHHEADGVPERARARDRSLGRLGWTIDRFPVVLIQDHPRAFVEAVRAGMAAAAARGQEPWPCTRCPPAAGC